MQQNTTINNKMIFAMCIASFVGMLAAVTITLAIVMPMMKVGAAPAQGTTAAVDPAYAAYVQGYMASTQSNNAQSNTMGTCTDPVAKAEAAAASAVSAPATPMGGMGQGQLAQAHDSYKKSLSTHNTYNYHNSNKQSFTSNVNSNNTVDSNNKWDNSSHTNIKVKDSFNGVGNKMEGGVKHEVDINNHSFNKDSYNNSVNSNNTSVIKDSFNKNKVEVKKETTIINDSFNKKKTEIDVDLHFKKPHSHVAPVPVQ